jgi:hypothetical protein
VLAVKSKEQALAVANALTAPADAKRHRQIESRQLQWFGNVPELKLVPEADRLAVFKAAQQYAGRRWYVYMPVLSVAMWAVLSQLAPQLLAAASIERIPSGLFFLVIVATLGLHRHALRSYVTREASEYTASATLNGSMTDV